MREGAIEKRLEALEQEIRIVGEGLEALKLDLRAEADTFRLEIEALRRCLDSLYPQLKDCLPLPGPKSFEKRIQKPSETPFASEDRPHRPDLPGEASWLHPPFTCCKKK